MARTVFAQYSPCVIYDGGLATSQVASHESIVHFGQRAGKQFTDVALQHLTARDSKQFAGVSIDGAN